MPALPLSSLAGKGASGPSLLRLEDGRTAPPAPDRRDAAHFLHVDAVGQLLERAYRDGLEAAREGLEEAGRSFPDARAGLALNAARAELRRRSGAPAPVLDYDLTRIGETSS